MHYCKSDYANNKAFSPINMYPRFYLPYVLKSAGLKEITSALLGNGVAGAISFVATSVVLLYASNISIFILN